MDSGGPLTTATSAGSGRSVTVEDSRFFTSGLGLTTGDDIQFGGAVYRVMSVPDDRTIELDRDATWSAGEPIGFPYRGSGPDRGAIERLSQYRLTAHAIRHRTRHRATRAVADFTVLHPSIRTGAGQAPIACGDGHPPKYDGSLGGSRRCMVE